MKRLILIAATLFVWCVSAEVYFEAEDFKGNGIVQNDPSAGGGKIVTGSNWYVFVKDIPIPEGKNFCFIRVRSAVKANWFLAYDPQRPFGWFQTPGNNEWVWVRIGEFQKNDRNNGLMPQIFMQKPVGADKTDGAVDAVVFAANKDEAQRIFQERNTPSESGNNFYMEAERYKGNGLVANDPSAGGGKIVTGKTWYVFAKNIPIPDVGKRLYCFVRVRTALPAMWFLAYDTAKPFGWFRTPGNNEWVWVCIGSFQKTETNNGLMPQIFLQKPASSTSAQSTDGAMDAIVFTESNDPARAEEIFNQQKDKKTESAGAAENAALAHLAGVQRFYSVRQVAAPPVIDGLLDDAAYRDAPEAADFILLGARAFAGQKTVVKVVWHGDCIYIAAKLYESQMPLLRRQRTQDNDSVWSDDCFEMYFDPGHSRKKAFQLVVNPNGVKQDSSLKRRIDEAGFSDLKLSWDVAVHRAADYWTVEAKIPLKLLTFDEVVPGTVWGVNFCRSEIPSGEKSFWNNTGEYFFKPERYGIMHFGDAPGNPQTISMNSEKGELAIEFAPLAPVDLTLSGRVSGSENAVVQKVSLTGPVTLSIPVSSKERKFTVQVDLGADGRHSSFAVDVRNYQDGLLSTLWPSEERNNRLPILFGTVQHSFWLFANHTAAPVGNIQAVITLPEGVELLDPTTDIPHNFYRRCRLAGMEKIQLEGKNFTRYTIDITGTLNPVDIRNLRFFDGITIYLKCVDPALIGQKLQCSTMIRSGNLIEEENLTTLEILPPRAGIQPERLIVHNWLWTWHSYTACTNDFLASMKTVGFNSVEADGTQFIPGRRAVFAANGLSLINNMFWEFHGTPGGAAAPAVKFDGTVNNSRLCPTAMLENNGRVLLINRERLLADIREGSMGVVWDLEGPKCWDLCFCERCIEAFRKFAEIAESVVLTPQIIREKHNQSWIRFCCRQSTEICRIIREEFRRINPAAKFGFYSGLPSLDTMETYRADWESAAGYIDLALLSYYTNSFTSLDSTFTEGMMRHIRSLKDMARRHNNELQVWATLTPGYMRNSSMVPPPELIKLAVLRSFASGADGVSFWWWGPFDGDYYDQLAQATAVIGKYERFFLAGESGISLKYASRRQGRYSTYTATVDGAEFMLLLNHSSVEIELDFENPGNRNFVDEFNEKSYGTGKFTLRLPPYGFITLCSGR